MLLPIHVVAGGVALVLGAVALLARKGATVHRTSGLLFVGAMVTMGFSGSALALQKSLTGPFTTPLMRALPIALVFVAMFYWLWRVRRRRPFVWGDRTATRTQPAGVR